MSSVEAERSLADSVSSGSASTVLTEQTHLDETTTQSVSGWKFRRPNRTVLTLLHLACIAVFALFICWGAQGRAPVNGDDIRVLHRLMLKRTNFQYDYLSWTRSRSHVVALLYNEFKLSGDSLERANLIWLGIYVASAFAAYFYLRMVFSPNVAVTGAIFYLCYASKFEPLTWWSAGAYTIIWTAFFGLMAAVQSKLGFRFKCLLVSAIVLSSLYIYEVFLVLVPFVSVILLAQRKRDIKKLKRADWLFSFLPLILTLIHVGTIASADKPIFLFEKSTVNKASFEARVVTGFTSALDATVGRKHTMAVKNAVHSYRDFYAKDEPALNLLLWLGIGLFVSALIYGAGATLAAAPNMVAVGENAIIGAAALFISAFIGFVSNFMVTPSRLTGIPSIGLMLLVCAVIEAVCFCARQVGGWKRSIVVAIALIAPLFTLAITIREGQAFCSFLKQAAEVDEFDQKIAKQIKALHPTVKQGDEIFVRIPRASGELTGRWRNFWSGFNSGRAFETLWYVYDVDPGTVSYSGTPYKCPAEVDRMQDVVENWAKTGIAQVYPFVVDENQHVAPVSQIVLTDSEGHKLKWLDFSKQFQHLGRDLANTQEIPVHSLPPQLH